MTSRARFSGLPDVPAIAEFGFSEYSVSGYQGIAAPAGLPTAISQQLQSGVAAVLGDTAVIAKLITIGNAPIQSTPDEFKSRLAQDIKQWRKVIAEAKIEQI